MLNKCFIRGVKAHMVFFILDDKLIKTRQKY